MTASIKILLVAFAILALAGEIVSSAAPDHDHHSDETFVEFDAGQSAPEDSSHVAHVCIACHNMMDKTAVIDAFVAVSSAASFVFPNDRFRTRALDPPFQPPIEISA